METTNQGTITVSTTVNAPIDKVWESFTTPEHIKNWNNASEDWCTPSAENDLREGGRFVYRMEAKDGSFGFDFGGEYEVVKDKKYIQYRMDDNRQVKISFITYDSATEVIETFDPEQTHSLDMQRTGWQAILDNFKRYTESLS